MEDADERLARAYAEVAAEIGRTDAKAGAMLTALGIPLAVLVAAIPGRDFSARVTVLAAISAAGLVAAMLLVLLVLRPHIGQATRGSFLNWADCTPDEVLEDLAPDIRLQQLLVRSQIARQKFTTLRLAVHITIGAVAVLPLVLLAAMAG
ncbi:Pycsar system effector family protein [Streptomyces sp. E11-3]|uniref:Pycsar system effector family protein n=1 Tax=Streptomyces sp. E11-3 TaxID=3110112 RepID=UPI003980A355